MSLRRHPVTRRTRPRQLRVEPLDGRLVPTTFMVTTTADVVSPTDHRLSLREAVTAANAHAGPDTIALGAGVYGIALPDGPANDNAGGDFDVTGPLSVRGQGAALTAIDGGGHSRLFDLAGTFDAAFRGLTLRDGGGPINGAGIQAVDANLTLTGCVVSTNSGLLGGGINAEHGNVTLVRTTVSGNVAQVEGGGVRLGTGTLALVGCAVRDNVGGGSGGGIFSRGPVTLARSTVSGNDAGADGGGIASAGLVALAGCTLGANRARDGGAVSADTATLSGTAVVGNFADRDGGGILANKSATLTACTVSSNSAGVNGGGIVGYISATLTACTVAGNAAAALSGGVYAQQSATLAGCTVSDNFAGIGAGGVGAQQVILTNCTISGNRTGGDGGGVFALGGSLVNVTITLNRARRGGGVFHDTGGGAFTVKNTIVAQNRIDTGGGAPDVSGVFTSGGHNLIGDVSGSTGFFLVNPTDQMGSAGNPLDPGLGPLQNNGGPTWTHALLAGSPAIDHGDNAALDPTGLPLKTDQRGRSRIRDGNGDGRAQIDIGAFER